MHNLNNKNSLTLLSPSDLNDPFFHALNLFDASEIHRYWTVADLQRLLVSPIQLNQCLFASSNGEVVGICTWGMFSEIVATGFFNRNRALQKEDWDSGELLWVIDFIAPFGHTKQFSKLIYRFLSEKYPLCNKAYAIRQYSNKHRRSASFHRKGF